MNLVNIKQIEELSKLKDIPSDSDGQTPLNQETNKKAKEKIFLDVESTDPDKSNYKALRPKKQLKFVRKCQSARKTTGQRPMTANAGSEWTNNKFTSFNYPKSK